MLENGAFKQLHLFKITSQSSGLITVKIIMIIISTPGMRVIYQAAAETVSDMETQCIVGIS